MTAPADRRTAARPARESRHQARELALQMLYQWEVGRASMADVRDTFWTHAEDPERRITGETQAFADALAEGVAAATGDIDPLIAAAAEHWRLERMNVLDRLILRMAIYELVHEPDIPARVVINEALELARTFSGDDSVRFVNGVLDAVRRKLDRA
jgi:N utilization substance protein B